MHPIDYLDSKLEQLNRELTSFPSNTKNLEKIISKLKTWVHGSEKPLENKDRVQAALKNFYQTQFFETTSQAIIVCYACTQAGVEKRSPLIEDYQRFNMLLKRVDEYQQRIIPFVSCYRGLLQGYFSYDARSKNSIEGLRSWEELRTFLERRADVIKKTKSNPDWVQAISEHKNLLTTNPCQPYGFAALNGDRQAFNDIRHRLNVANNSWLIRQMVAAQLDAAVVLSDREFKAKVNVLLELLNEHPLLIDIGLVKILNRYAECADKKLHEGLRDFSVSYWKNPWLTSNAARWGSVCAAAKNMISAWLKERLIDQFFSLLAEDGANDTRRVKFWRRYIDVIEDMYFALGKRSMQDDSEVFKEIRKAMEGRLLRLTDGGSGNAFIMMIGDLVVVEFGTPGNAAFLFDRKNIPFRLDLDHVSVKDLKSNEKIYFAKLVHQDGIHGFSKWEDRFSDVIERKVNGYLQKKPQEKIKKTYQDQDFSDFAMKYKFSVDDLRHKGGNLWLKPWAKVSDEQHGILNEMGFIWSQKRNAYYKDS